MVPIDRSLKKSIPKQKQDYDSSFQNNFLLTHGLIKHAIFDNGQEYPNHQSVISFAFPVIQNVAMRFFADTGNLSYLNHMYDYYHSIVKSHRAADGYVSAVDPSSLTTDPYSSDIDLKAGAYIANKVFLTIMPSKNVTITWTWIGNFGIAEPFITTFSDAGWFNAVKFDFQDRTITMGNVSGKGMIRFSGDIVSAALDGKEYPSFNASELQTVE
jgi:hypothetical protein